MLHLSHMNTAQQLIQHITESAKDTPYVITQTADGFELSLNIVDARWVMPLGTGNIKKYFTITAKLDETSRVARLNDSLYELEWSAGLNGQLVPHIGAQVQVQQGTIYQVHIGGVLGTQTESGITTYQFSSSEAKKWLNAILAQDGWKKAMSIQTKIGIIAACFGGLVALGAIILILVM